MDLRKLRFFLAAVDTGGFTRAAAAEFVAQPSLSQAIRELEAELGVELFHRVGRRVVLSAAGSALVEPARQALRDVDTARAAVDAVVGLRTGRLELASLPTMASDPVARLVGTFRIAHPGVFVHLRAPDDPAQLVETVRSGESELGITERLPPRTGLVSHELNRQDLVVVLPPGFSDRPLSWLSLHRLESVPMITTPAGTSSRRLFDEAFATVAVTPTIAVVAEQREAILPLVLAGAGAALLPVPQAETARRLGATVAAIRPKVSRTVVLVHRDSTLSPGAARFVELAA